MKKILPFLLIFVSFITLLLGAWPILHNDIYFISDIARDFLLFNEIEEKFMILIGPRASGMPGLFHGVLWLYLNFPAYFIGNGNPVVVGYFWIVLVVFFCFIYYFLFKIFFDKTTSLVFVTLFVFMIAPFMDQFYNPVGALLIMPLIYYFTYQYIVEHKWKDAILLFLFVGAVIQFQMAAGIPISLLIMIVFLYTVIKTKNYKHLFIPLILIIPLGNFLLFDLKHNFVQTNVVLKSFIDDTRFYTPYDVRLSDRLRTVKDGGGIFFHEEFSKFNKYIGYILIGLLLHYLWKNRDLKRGLLVYYYVGFYILSLLHNGVLLVHYVLPVMLLPVLFFASSYKKIPSQIYWVMIIAVSSLSLYSLSQRIEYYENNKYRWQYWKSLNSVFDVIEKTHTQDKIGIFMYAPDVYAYGPKYAFLYNKKNSDSIEYNYHKKLRETYLLYEPPPPGQPQFNGTDWKSRQVNIKNKPVESITLNNGYSVEKYILTEEEQNTPHDTIIDDWVSQR
ncbi:MAG TPA: hypothetical protein PLS49_01050 [Candidatus Woesebacteria bacterium]|nr:hypothetical protein [Candidatus Woesebacteria bacterium]